MRKLVVGTGLGFDTPVEKQIEILTEVGWDGVFTEWDEKNGIAAFAKKVRECGSYYQSVHAPFGGADRLWNEGEAGEREADKLIRCLEDCAQNGVTLVVMHAIIGMDKHTPTPLGLERFGHVFERAERLGVTVALENTEGEEYLESLFNAYTGMPNVRFCIDTGHEMCYNRSRDLIGKYGDKLVSTHLNDNMGMTGTALTWLDDSHLLPFDGVADWNGIVSRLKKVGFAGDLTFELLSKNRPGRNCSDIYKDMDITAFASAALERAKSVAALFEK